MQAFEDESELVSIVRHAEKISLTYFILMRVNALTGWFSTN
jgi:hypothetical protein